MLNFCEGLENGAPEFTHDELIASADKLRKRKRTDAYGVSVAVILCFIKACPDSAASLFARMLASGNFMASFKVQCLLYGKESPHTTVDKIQGISPLPSLLQVIDVLLANVNNQTVTETLTPPIGVWIGAQPKTQILDIAHGVHLVIEKALDRFSEGSVATLDVSRFYDSVRLLKSAQWLQANGLSTRWCAAMLRFQLLCSIVLKAGHVEVEILGRSCGSLTGSRTAGAASRIPVECSVCECAARNAHKGFCAGPVSLTFATYVDNVFAAGDSAANAVFLLDDFAEILLAN